VARRRRRRSVARHRQRDALAILHARLVETYGEPRPKRSLAPIDEMVLTILSQNTSDTNRDRAWERLRATFIDWEAVEAAPLADVERALKPGGLQRIKAKRIRETLARVREEYGSYDLSHLAELDVEEARLQLSAIKGIGAKSANCILLFSLGRPAFPVDTHVYRVLHRIGVHRTRDMAAANLELRDAIPDGTHFVLHMNVIRHGREVCHARRPACVGCAVSDLCGYKDKTEIA
jgi:endonuclease-3